jgi:hypothetical protein
MKFPSIYPRIQWAPFETGYLELFLRKIELAAMKDDTIVMPHTTKILKAFNEYFDSRNDIRDKKGNVIDSMTARNSGSLTSHMNRQKSELRKLRDSMSNLPIGNGDDVYMPEITDTEIEAYMNDGAVIGDSGNAEADDAQVPNKHFQGADKPLGPQSQSGHAPTPPQPPHTSSTAAGTENGTISVIPETNKEAIQLHRDEKNKRPLDTTWIHEGITDLDRRITKHKGNPKLKSDLFHRDRVAKYDTTKEDWHIRSLRENGAAAVNAVLNAADLPPLGYTGDIPHLVKKKLLPNDELVLAESRAAAIQKVWAMRKKEAETYMKNNTNLPIQRDINVDSDSTGDESVGDMDA